MNKFGQKHENPTTIDQPPVEKRNEDALFPNGFWRNNQWWPHWDRRTDKPHFISGPTRNSIASTAKSFKRRSSTWLANNGNEQTLKNTKRNSWTSIRSLWYLVLKTFHSHDQSHKSNSWVASSTKKRHHFRHASGSTQFSFHLHATQACRQSLFYLSPTFIKPNGTSDSIRKTNCDSH